MTDQQIKEQVKAIQELTADVLAQGPDACRKFLRDAGIEIVAPQSEEKKVTEEGEWLLCAAIDYNGKIICGRRHGDCYAILEGWVNPDELPTRDEQGFLTSTGRFVDRKEGYLIAKANNQIKYGGEATEDTLISENLY